ncbi:Hypothetical_protein [Hexamita inflata]|uniref:Hypothetical_protein n=1 Tax=Hexamita inflata TaxID=28002 RepID=A0AA86PYQ0_9EUKA|nr:Hypothetical protein HINF_LOCUS36470 [Hexamita inflata]
MAATNQRVEFALHMSFSFGEVVGNTFECLFPKNGYAEQPVFRKVKRGQSVRLAELLSQILIKVVWYLNRIFTIFSLGCRMQNAVNLQYFTSQCIADEQRATRNSADESADELTAAIVQFSEKSNSAARGQIPRVFKLQLLKYVGDYGCSSADANASGEQLSSLMQKEYIQHIQRQWFQQSGNTRVRNFTYGRANRFGLQALHFH